MLVFLSLTLAAQVLIKIAKNAMNGKENRISKNQEHRINYQMIKRKQTTTNDNKIIFNQILYTNFNGILKYIEDQDDRTCCFSA